MSSLKGYKLVSKTGTYVLNQIAGRGAFATVYKATRVDDGKVVAIKVIEKRKLVGKSFDNLCREIEIMRTVKHPNVLSLEDLLETEGHLFLITRFMSGGELFDRIVARGHFSESDAVRILKQILGGIEYLHSVGICHRDLKPENLLCTEEEDNFIVVITDFGFSKIFGRGELMKTGCGTLHYAAPDILHGLPYTEACDMWAFGVVCYVVLTGCFPFDGAAPELGAKILKGDYSLGNLDACNVSQLARSFIASLLVVDPKKRLTAAQCLSHPWFNSEPETRNLRAEGTSTLALQRSKEDQKNAISPAASPNPSPKPK